MVVNRQKLSTMTLRPRNAEQADSKGTFKTHSTDHRDPDRSARTGQITPTKRMRAPRAFSAGALRSHAYPSHMSLYVLLAYWEKRESGVCSLFSRCTYLVLRERERHTVLIITFKFRASHHGAYRLWLPRRGARLHSATHHRSHVGRSIHLNRVLWVLWLLWAPAPSRPGSTVLWPERPRRTARRWNFRFARCRARGRFGIDRQIFSLLPSS